MDLKERKNEKLILLALLLAAGFLTDFILVGIFKVIWMLIYGTAYLALAMTIDTAVYRSKYKAISKASVLAFLSGAILGHLIFVNHRRTDHYSMNLLSENPLVLKSSEFPEYLYVESPSLTETLHRQNLTQNIVMETESLTDYDCMKTFTIRRINDFNIPDDTKSTWTLRYNKVGVFSTAILPSMNDNTWPWCKISFYRTNSAN